MLTVTVAASDRLLSKIVAKKASDEEAMRFTRRNGRWRLRLDYAKQGDKTFKCADRTVLLLDETVSRAMNKMKLDVKDADLKPRLSLRKVTKDQA